MLPTLSGCDIVLQCDKEYPVFQYCCWYLINYRKSEQETVKRFSFPKCIKSQCNNWYRYVMITLSNAWETRPEYILCYHELFIKRWNMFQIISKSQGGGTKAGHINIPKFSQLYEGFYPTKLAKTNAKAFRCVMVCTMVQPSTILSLVHRPHNTCNLNLLIAIILVFALLINTKCWIFN